MDRQPNEHQRFPGLRRQVFRRLGLNARGFRRPSLYTSYTSLPRVEALQPRILLSATSLASALLATETAARLAIQSVTFAESEPTVGSSGSNTVPGAQSTLKNTALVFSQANGNQISITSAWDSVQLSATHGTLTLSQTQGLTFSQGTGVNETAMSYSGTHGQMNNALQGLIFTPASNYTGSATITLTTTNSGLLGLGLLGSSETDKITVTITPPVNQPPAASATGVQSTAEDTPLIFSTAASNAFSVSDADSGGNSEQLTLIATNGTLNLATTTGLTFSSGSGTGNASMTFTGTISNINAALNGLRFTPGTHFVGAAGISLGINDLGNSGTGGAKTASASASINVTAVAHTPSITNAVAAENGQSTSGLIITPNAIDSSSIWFKITNITGGTLFQNDGTTPINANDYISASQGGAGLKFTPTSGSTSPGGFIAQASTAANDAGLGGSAVAATITVFAPPMNHIPGPQTVAQNTPLFFTAANGNSVSVSDPSAGTGADTVELDVANGSLSLSQTSGLHFTAGNGTSDSSIIFSGTLANINAALNGMSFAPANGYSGQLSIRMVTTDSNNPSVGALSTTNTVAVTAAPPNQPPTFDVPASQSTPEDGALVFSGTAGNAITVSDLSAGSGAVTVSLGATNGTIALATTSGLTFISGGNSSGAMSFSGTTAAINSALSGATFTPATHFAGTAGISGSITDSQNSASGTVTINVSRAAHTLSLTNAAARENSPTTSGLVLSPNPLDSGLNGFFEITNIAGGTLYLNDGVTAVTSGQFITFAQGQAGLTFVPAANSISTGTFIAQASTSADITGLGGATILASISVTAPPTVSVNAGTLNFTQGQTTVAIDPSLAVTDPGSATLNGATIQLNGYVAGEDVLNFTNQNGISGSWDAASGTMILTGTASISTYQAALRSVRYTDISSNPSTLPRTAQFIVTDGSATSAAASRQIQVIPLNVAPDVAVPGPQSVTAGQTLVFSIGNGNAIAVGDSDANGGIEEVTLSTTHGTLTLSTESGLTFVSGDGSGTVTFDATLNTLNAVLNGLQFAPNSNFAGQSSLSIAINDLGNSGAGGALSTSASVAMTVDAPIIVTPVPLVVNRASLDLSTNLSAPITSASLEVATADGSSSPITYEVTQLPVLGQLLLDGNPVQVGTTFSPDDLSAGRLRYSVTATLTTADSFALIARDDAGAFVGPTVFNISHTPPSPPTQPPQPTPTPQYPTPPVPQTPQQPASSLLPPDESTTGTITDANAASGSSDDQREKQIAAVSTPAPIPPTVGASTVSPTVTLQARYGDNPFAKVQIPTAEATAAAGNGQHVNPFGRGEARYLSAPSAIKTIASAFNVGTKPVFDTNAVAPSRGTAFWHELDSLHTRMVSDTNTRVWAGSAMCVSVGTSVAYLMWIIRGGSLLSSFLSSVPVWQLVDPLPILNHAASAAAMRGRAAEDNDGLDALIGSAAGG